MNNLYLSVNVLQMAGMPIIPNLTEIYANTLTLYSFWFLFMSIKNGIIYKNLILVDYKRI